MHPSLDEQLHSELHDLESRGLLRTTSLARGASRTEIDVSGVGPAVSFCSNDYLGLSSDPRLFLAASAAFSSSGFGASASRLVAGNLPEHELFETDLAHFLDYPAALLFPSGYQANIGAITALAGPEDLIVADRLVHASLMDAFRLSRAKLAPYKHLDLAQARHHLSRLGSSHRRRFLVTESLFSMDGDLAPLPELAALASQFDAAFVVDEAHAIGTLGPSGRGLSAHHGIKPDVLVATFGKAFGSSGAAVLGSANLRSLLLNRARSFIYTTALPAPVAAASRAALRIIRSPDGDSLRSTLAARACHLRSALQAQDSPNLPSPIVPIILGHTASALDAAHRLALSGIFVQSIRPPTVPSGQARLRITLSASHTSAQIDTLIEALRPILARPPHPFLTAQSPGPAPSPLPPRGLVLLGTDTGVGKTSVACGLLHLLRQRGFAPVPFKPVETGVDPTANDALALLRASGRPNLSLDIVCPYRAKVPVAPAAAFPSDTLPDPLRLLALAANAAALGDFLLVETAGGLLSPYGPRYTAADLAAALRLPVLLVARNGLGTINHTALAIAEIRRRSLPLLGLILVDTSFEATPDRSTNASLITAQTSVVPFGTLPYVPSGLPADLAAALESSADIPALLAAILRPRPASEK